MARPSQETEKELEEQYFRRVDPRARTPGDAFRLKAGPGVERMRPERVRGLLGQSSTLIEWYIKQFFGVHFAANWVFVLEGFLVGK